MSSQWATGSAACSESVGCGWALEINDKLRYPIADYRDRRLRVDLRRRGDQAVHGQFQSLATGGFLASH
jgi:hypothetical protein